MAIGELPSSKLTIGELRQKEEGKTAKLEEQLTTRTTELETAEKKLRQFISEGGQLTPQSIAQL